MKATYKIAIYVTQFEWQNIVDFEIEQNQQEMNIIKKRIDLKLNELRRCDVHNINTYPTQYQMYVYKLSHTHCRSKEKPVSLQKMSIHFDDRD